MSLLKGLVKHAVPERWTAFLRSVLLVGTKVKCPCCGWWFRTFLPSPRPNSQCPRCGSLERHRLLWLYLQTKTPLFSKPLTLLHLAPEPVYYRALKARRNLQYITADIGSALARVRLDIMRLPYVDNCIDAILCVHVLEHVDDDRAAMRELRRVLKPGGWAILQVPIDITRETTLEDPTIVAPEERERVFGQHDHVRLYGQDYKDRLVDAGFTVTVDSYPKELGPRLVARYRVWKDEDIYRCLKATG